MHNWRGHPFVNASCRVRLIGLSLTILLCSSSVDSISPKAILWLIRLKNMRFYNQEKELFVDSPIPDSLDQKCRQYDAWRDPLSGSTPAEEVVAPAIKEGLMQLVADKTRDDVIRKSQQSLPILERMLDNYEEYGLFENWREKTPQVTFVPKMFWRRPWDLKDKAEDIYQLLTTYSRILHYYVCILNDEHNTTRKFIRYTGKSKTRLYQRREETFRKRAYGIDREDDFDNIEENLFLMMGHVYLELHNTSIVAVSQMTLDHDVNKAIGSMRLSQNIGMRIYYRANLCHELYLFLKEVSDRNAWAQGDDDSGLKDIYALEYKIYEKLKYENSLLKEYKEIDISDLT